MAKIDESKLVPYDEFYDDYGDEDYSKQSYTKKKQNKFKNFRKKMKDKYKVGNFLTQDFNGLLRQVPKNYVLVKERPLRGGIKLCRNGHPILIAPWTKRTLISLASQVMDFDFASTIGSENQIQVKVPVSVTWKVNDDDAAIERFYSEKNAVDVLKSKMFNFLSKVVASYPHDKLKDISIKFSNLEESFKGIDDDKRNVLISAGYSIINEASKLGITLDDANFKDADYPKEVSDAYNAAAAEKIKKQTELNSAASNVEIQEEILKATKIKNSGTADLLTQLIAAGVSSENAAKIVERMNMPSGANVFDFNGGNSGSELSSLVAAILTAKSDKVNDDGHHMGM